MRQGRAKPDQRGGILRLVEETVRDAGGPVAVGLDMAAQSDNWGLCVIALAADLRAGRFAALLPQAKLNADGGRSQTLLFRPDPPLVRRVLELVRAADRGGSLAVDTPFGWPAEQCRFLDGWSAADGWRGAGYLPAAGQFAWRLCDRRLAEVHRPIRPLAVGADMIALSSFAWSVARADLAPLLGTLDFGLDGRAAGFATFETYPGAFVRLVSGESGDYKGRPDVRRRLLDALRGEYALEMPDGGDEWLAWACAQKGSPNAFDAFLCALTAWDHLRWRAGHAGVALTTPEVLLRRAPTAAEAEQIRREGWILVRTPIAPPEAGTP
jgi:hypothetical protein